MRLFTRSVTVLLAVAVAMAIDGQVAWGQANQQGGTGGGGGNGGGGQGRRGNFDPAQMRQQMLDRVKEALGAPDDEWNVIAPRLQKVVELQFASRGGGMGGLGGFGGRRGGNNPGAPAPGADAAATPANPPAANPPAGNAAPRNRRPTSPEGEALQKLLDAKDSTPEQIKTALKNYRDAEAKQVKALQDARQSLREVLTMRQEALLVIQRVLD